MDKTETTAERLAVTLSLPQAMLLREKLVDGTALLVSAYLDNLRRCPSANEEVEHVERLAAQLQAMSGVHRTLLTVIQQTMSMGYDRIEVFFAPSILDWAKKTIARSLTLDGGLYDHIKSNPDFVQDFKQNLPVLNEIRHLLDEAREAKAPTEVKVLMEMKAPEGVQ